MLCPFDVCVVIRIKFVFYFFYSVVITSSGFIGDLRKYYYQVGLLYILFIYHNVCVCSL